MNRLTLFPVTMTALIACLLLSMIPSMVEAKTLPALRCPVGSAPSTTPCRAPATGLTPLAGSGNCCPCPSGSYSADGAACRRCVTGLLAVDGVDLSQSGAQCSCLPGYGDYDPVAMSCRRCPINTYSSNSKCLPCAANTFAPAQSTSCSSITCPLDSYLPPGGATIADCTRCKFGTAGQLCDTVQGCNCMAGFAGFDKTSGQCTQCAHTNAIAIYADMVKQDPTATVCADCPAGTIATLDRRQCLSQPQGNVMYPPTAIPTIACNTCFLDTEIAFALDTPELQSRVMTSARSPTFSKQSNTFRAEFERRLVDEADRLCPDTENDKCALMLRRVQLLHLRAGDFILTPRATGASELRYMHFLAHPLDKPTESADITTLYYKGADGSMQSISLTPDHVLPVVSGTQSEASLPRLPTESEFVSAPLSERDLLGDSGPLSMWIPSEDQRHAGNLRAAGDIVAGDYIWHQPLPGSGASVNEAGVVSVPLPVLVRVERVVTEVQFNITLQVPVASSFLYSVSGVVANMNSEVSTAMFARIRFSPVTVWLMNRWPSVGRTILDSLIAMYGYSEPWVLACIVNAHDDQNNNNVSTMGFASCTWRHAADSRFAQWVSDSMITIIIAALLSIGAASFIRQKVNSGKNALVQGRA